MEDEKLEVEVRQSLALVGIRILKTIPAAAAFVFDATADDEFGNPQRVQIRVVKRKSGGALVTIESETRPPIEQASFVSTRDALLKSAVQWEARHSNDGSVPKTIPLEFSCKDLVTLPAPVRDCTR